MRDHAYELQELMSNGDRSTRPRWGASSTRAGSSSAALASTITNDAIDDWYERALEAGAIGGKLCGAGGGGCILIRRRRPSASEAVREALHDLVEVPVELRGPRLARAAPGGRLAMAAPVACIVCGSDSVEPFLDLGETALANKFLPAEELETAEPAYPLIVGFCSNCTHIQLTEHVPPPDMFEDYLYVSSASDTLKDHLWDLSDSVVERCGLGEGDLVIDIGANDGSLLKGFRRHGVQALGSRPGSATSPSSTTTPRSPATRASSTPDPRRRSWSSTAPPRRSPPPTPSRTSRRCRTSSAESTSRSPRAGRS